MDRGLIHATLDGVGENLYYAKNSDGSHVEKITMTDAASRIWYEKEEHLYDYEAADFVPAAGHFTAMVWKSTCNMGCGYSENYVVCRYTPQGNILGRFEENVMPRME